MPNSSAPKLFYWLWVFSALAGHSQSFLAGATPLVLGSSLQEPFSLFIVSWAFPHSLQLSAALYNGTADLSLVCLFNNRWQLGSGIWPSKGQATLLEGHIPVPENNVLTSLGATVCHVCTMFQFCIICITSRRNGRTVVFCELPGFKNTYTAYTVSDTYTQKYTNREAGGIC